jgi:hypothetical protein
MNFKVEFKPNKRLKHEMNVNECKHMKWRCVGVESQKKVFPILPNQLSLWDWELS